MAYEAFTPLEWKRKFRLVSYAARIDGSGQLGMDIFGDVAPVGTEDWIVDKHYNPMLPGLDMDAVLASAAGAGARGQAVLALAVEHRSDSAEPVQGDSDEAMEARQNGNLLSAHVKAGLDDLLVELGITLPYEFTLS